MIKNQRFCQWECEWDLACCFKAVFKISKANPMPKFI